MDEKIFIMEQKFNKQNRLYSDISKGQSKSSWNGTTGIYFCMPEVKTTTKIYEETSDGTFRSLR